jgi:hypothetical protein
MAKERFKKFLLANEFWAASVTIKCIETSTVKKGSHFKIKPGRLYLSVLDSRSSCRTADGLPNVGMLSRMSDCSVAADWLLPLLVVRSAFSDWLSPWPASADWLPPLVRTALSDWLGTSTEPFLIGSSRLNLDANWLPGIWNENRIE